LVVDDDQDIRELIGELLASEGYPVVSLANGAEALTFIEEDSEQTPALVLVDLMMPVMSGYDFIKAMQAKQSAVPIVTMSAFDAGPLPGTFAAVRKPVSLLLLLDLVKKICGVPAAE
jgi:CheY-like chemotaxis protein